MARKKKHEEHENHERWLVSYADFITLLFAFFVVMYSVSSVNEGKYRVLSDALVAAFRSSTKTIMPIQIGKDAKSPENQSLARQSPALLAAPELPLPNVPKQSVREISKGIGQIASKVRKALADLVEEELISIRQDDNWLEVEIKSNILFESGSARIQKKSTPILLRLAETIAEFTNPVRVEGYTDNEPISSPIFPSNWELSAGRASSVVHLFSDMGVEPRRMSAVAFSEYHPIADNATLEGRQKNRRVVIVILENDESQKLRDQIIFEAADNKIDPQPTNANQQAKVATAIEAPEPSKANEKLEPDVNGYAPNDVTGKEKTDTGWFEVIQSPIKIMPIISLDQFGGMSKQSDSMDN